MGIEFHAGATDDYESSLAWYEQQSRAAAIGFVEEVHALLQIIEQYPLGFAIHIANCRSATVSRYPYQVIYRVKADRIVVIAFAHASRRPGYWIPRLKDE